MALGIVRAKQALDNNAHTTDQCGYAAQDLERVIQLREQSIIQAAKEHFSGDNSDDAPG